MDDFERIERVKQGDESAFREIVEKHREAIFNLCVRYLGSPEDAEEIAQDVFIKLYRHIPKYEPRAKLSTLLYRMAVNLSLNRIRDRKRRRWISLDRFPETSVQDGSRDIQDQPQQLLERKERQTAVRQAVDALPPNQRMAVILKRFQGLSYAEIADVMSCSVSAVESRLHRAKQTLRKKLSSLVI